MRLAQFSLGVRSLNPQQVKALETYYDVVQGAVGIDGSFVRVENYTFSQRRRIVKGNFMEVYVQALQYQ